ncbi:jg22957 [Pararge aegeria aegeria]|uniref:Jg22957 protein n=1 Tax=Pararge aegeria aegeria TaxID=348720 RepID=A0A8S4QEU4_9NEOP|nr:jg22957 [Pararge aegeria aegeria]
MVDNNSLVPRILALKASCCLFGVIAEDSKVSATHGSSRSQMVNPSLSDSPRDFQPEDPGGYFDSFLGLLNIVIVASSIVRTPKTESWPET